MSSTLIIVKYGAAVEYKSELNMKKSDEKENILMDVFNTPTK